MANKLGAELSQHGITEQQACKRNGLHVDWSGRSAAARLSLCFTTQPLIIIPLSLCCRYVRQRPVHQRPALKNSIVKKTS